MDHQSGVDLRMAQCHDNRVPCLRLRDTIRVPGGPGTRSRDTTQGHDRVPYRVPIVSLNRVPLGHESCPNIWANFGPFGDTTRFVEGHDRVVSLNRVSGSCPWNFMARL